MTAALETRPLRIIVADDEVDARQLYGMMLRVLGHEVVGSAADGEALADLFHQTQPDVVLTDINMPARDGIAAATRIWRERPLPIVFVSGNYDALLLERSQMDHVMGYLTKPVTLEGLARAIDLAVRRFKQFEVVRAEAKSLITAGSDWHVVCQAKQVLLQTNPQSEDAAFDRLLELARSTNQGVARAAQSVVSAYNLAEK